MEGDSGMTNLCFDVRLTSARTNATNFISVDFATVDGGARAGRDYLATNGTLSFLPGQTNARARLQPIWRARVPAIRAAGNTSAVICSEIHSRCYAGFHRYQYCLF